MQCVRLPPKGTYLGDGSSLAGCAQLGSCCTVFIGLSFCWDGLNASRCQALGGVTDVTSTSFSLADTCASFDRCAPGAAPRANASGCCTTSTILGVAVTPTGACTQDVDPGACVSEPLKGEVSALGHCGADGQCVPSPPPPPLTLGSCCTVNASNASVCYDGMPEAFCTSDEATQYVALWSTERECLDYAACPSGVGYTGTPRQTELYCCVLSAFNVDYCTNDVFGDECVEQGGVLCDYGCTTAPGVCRSASACAASTGGCCLVNETELNASFCYEGLSSAVQCANGTNGGYFASYFETGTHCPAICTNRAPSTPVVTMSGCCRFTPDFWPTGVCTNAHDEDFCADWSAANGFEPGSVYTPDATCMPDGTCVANLV